MIYKMLPDVSIQWSDVWIGAGMTSLLFTIGKFLIGLYLGKSDVGIAYGAAGSLVVILCGSTMPRRYFCSEQSSRLCMRALMVPG